LELQEISLKYPSLHKQTLLNKNVFIHDYITEIERTLRQVKPPQKVLQAAQELVEDAENADATTTKVQELQKIGKQLEVFQEELSDKDIYQAKKIANNITEYLYEQTLDQIVGKTNLQILETFL
jgi:protein subunit release factor A